MDYGDGAQIIDERAHSATAGAREREAFAQGAYAVLPHDKPQHGLLAVSGIVGDLPEHRHDRFARYGSLAEFLGSCGMLLSEASVKAKAGKPSYVVAYKLRQLHQGPHVDAAWEGLGRDMGFTEVKRFMQAGWPEGAAKIREAIAQVEPPPAMDIRRRGIWADSGDNLSTDRLGSGAYETAWRTTKKRQAYGVQRVRIVVDIGSTCSACGSIGHNMRYLSASSLFWRGAAAASLCENLENAGYRVELVTASGIGDTARNGQDYRTVRPGDPGYDLAGDPISLATTMPDRALRPTSAAGTDRSPENNYGWKTLAPDGKPTRLSASANTCGQAVILKDFDAPIDMGTIAAGTACAAMFRRCTFLSHLANAHPDEDVHGLFGAMLAVEHSPRLRRELLLDEEGVATLFVGQWVLTEKLANAWARGALYGIESHRTGYTEEDMQLEVRA